MDNNQDRLKGIWDGSAEGFVPAVVTVEFKAPAVRDKDGNIVFGGGEFSEQLDISALYAADVSVLRSYACSSVRGAAVAQAIKNRQCGGAKSLQEFFDAALGEHAAVRGVTNLPKGAKAKAPKVDAKVALREKIASETAGMDDAGKIAYLREIGLLPA